MVAQCDAENDTQASESLPRSRFLDVTQRSTNVLLGERFVTPKNGCEGG